MQTWMRNSVFDRHFEFSNFTDLKQSHRQISLSYSYSAGNLAIENTRFKKSIRICPTLIIITTVYTQIKLSQLNRPDITVSVGCNSAVASCTTCVWSSITAGWMTSLDGRDTDFLADFEAGILAAFLRVFPVRVASVPVRIFSWN